MLWGLKITEMDYYYFVIQNQCASGSALYSLVSRFLFLLIVVREYQTEVIVVPALLVGFFVIVLTVILWLHCRGLRAKQQQSSSSGHQGKKKSFSTSEECWCQWPEVKPVSPLFEQQPSSSMYEEPEWYSAIQ